MARLIYHDATGPARVDPQDKPIFICMCGLSQDLPRCDGSHKAARQNEQPGKLCIYDKARRSIIEVRDDSEAAD